MERGNVPIDRWLDQAVSGIRFGPDRAAVRAELEAHMEDKAADLQRIFPDISREEAEERTLSEMGDPAEIGKELARVHKPWLGWLWRASGVLLALVLIAFLGLNFALGDDAFLGDDSDAEFWDFDAMPFDRGRMDWYETTYLHGEDPGQLLTFSPGLEQEAAGQRISALRGALWEEEGTQVLYLYLRVDTWKFWALGILKEEWMTVTDDRGNRYGLGLDAPRNPSGGLLSSLSGGAGKGPFHRGYTLRVWGIDPQAETIYLSYGPGDPVFTFTLDLEEGAA